MTKLETGARIHCENTNRLRRPPAALVNEESRRRTAGAWGRASFRFEAGRVLSAELRAASEIARQRPRPIARAGAASPFPETIRARGPRRRAHGRKSSPTH